MITPAGDEGVGKVWHPPWKNNDGGLITCTGEDVFEEVSRVAARLTDF